MMTAAEARDYASSLKFNVNDILDVINVGITRTIEDSKGETTKMNFAYKNFDLEDWRRRQRLKKKLLGKGYTLSERTEGLTISWKLDF